MEYVGAWITGREKCRLFHLGQLLLYQFEEGEPCWHCTRATQKDKTLGIMMTKQSDLDQILCDCTGTTRRKICHLVKEGVDTLDAISRRTGALSGCGGCEWDIEDYLEEFRTDKA